MSSQPILLDVENLRVDFVSRGTSLNAVNSVSFKVSAGETVGIVGESGSGKSVASLAIMGLIHQPGYIRSGQVKLFGEDLRKLTSRQRRGHLGKDISMIFQDATESLNPVYTIARQINESLKIHENMGRAVRKKRALELMQIVGMPEPEKVLASFPHQLSGGMNQRVMIAMAIACNPSLLIADEPTTALDVTVQEKILHLLHSLQQKNNMGIIFISHDLSVISAIASKIIVMYSGQIVEECSTSDLLESALHPYTEALLKCLPENYSAANRRMDSIDGIQATASEFLPGCRFQPRCRYARELCSTQAPALNTVINENGRSVRCFYPLKILSGEGDADTA